MQQDILLSLDRVVEVDVAFLDAGMIAHEVSHGLQRSKSVHKSERAKVEIFMRLVTQCFQLCIRLQESGSGRDLAGREASQRGLAQQRQRLEDAYLSVLAKVLECMAMRDCFPSGLKVFVLAVQLIDSDSQTGLSQLMKKQGDKPLRILVGKLLEKDVTSEEASTILELLINYAATATGATHLSKCQILDSLFKANIMQRLNEQDLYVSKQMKSTAGESSLRQIRNPAHVHWCQLLLLLRTLNNSLLANPQLEHQHFFEDLVRQVHHFKQRIPKVLHIGLTMEA